MKDGGRKRIGEGRIRRNKKMNKKRLSLPEFDSFKVSVSNINLHLLLLSTTIQHIRDDHQEHYKPEKEIKQSHYKMNQHNLL